MAAKKAAEAVGLDPSPVRGCRRPPSRLLLRGTHGIGGRRHAKPRLPRGILFDLNMHGASGDDGVS